MLHRAFGAASQPSSCSQSERLKLYSARKACTVAVIFASQAEAWQQSRKDWLIPNKTLKITHFAHSLTMKRNQLILNKTLKITNFARSLTMKRNQLQLNEAN